MDLPLPADPHLALSPEHQRRLELTVSCRDADTVPKVADAGEVRMEGGVRIQVMHEGTKVVADAYQGAWQTEVIRRLRGHHEPQEEIVIHRIFERLRDQPGEGRPLVMELGAWWSYYSIWAMRSVGAEAVLVEPDRLNLAVARRNLELNGLDAHVVEAAVGAAHGSTMRLRLETEQVKRDVPVVSVPGLLADLDRETIDFLLIDAQGAEQQVLTLCAPLLRSGAIRFVVVSTHHQSISGDPAIHQRCRGLIEAVGGHIIAEHTVGESFSGDGLIAASFRPEDADLRVPISYARYRESLFGELEYELASPILSTIRWRLETKLPPRAMRLVARLLPASPERSPRG